MLARRPLIRRVPPVAPAPGRRCARGFYRRQQGRVEFRHPPELDHASADRDEPIRLARLQPHVFEMLAQRFLMLAEPFAGLAQTQPRLGGVRANHRQGPEQPLGRGEVILRRQQLAQPVQRIGVFWLDLQDPPVARFRVGWLSLPVKLGRLLQHVRDAPGVDPAAEVPAVPGLQNGATDLALGAAERIFVRLVAAQEVVFRKAVCYRVANADPNYFACREVPIERYIS